MTDSELRKLPSVDRILQYSLIQPLIAEYRRDPIVSITREALDEVRQEIMRGQLCPDVETLAELIVAKAETCLQCSLYPVINATGVIIHTNLGRAPLNDDAMAAMQSVARGYSNLEFDLEEGERGSRYDHAEELLCRLTGAGAALLVNNNAGAVLLTLSALAEEEGDEVIISRSQLVEIGGGFRIPDVMAQSGAKLIEVGTTNRTYQHDYEDAITDDTALLMRVHYSNFHIAGFVHHTSLEDLVELGSQYNILVVDDLGSGTLLDTAPYSLAHEPMVQESVAAGADIVTFSGDKLLGGPQAGIIVGRDELISRLRRYPLTRALRVDKTTIAGLQATLLHYLRGEAPEKIPVWRMIAVPLAEIEARAQRWVEHLTARHLTATVIAGESTVGGGSLPGQTLPTRLVAITTDSPDALSKKLRLGKPAVVSRVGNDQLWLDPRTVLPAQDEALLAALVQAAG